MKEIVIADPSFNSDPQSDWSFRYPADSSAMFKEFQLRRKITPNTHPLACDLFAGQGGVTAILLEQGWLPNNITCIDIGKPENHTVLYGDWASTQKAVIRKWKHWDLAALATALFKKQPLP